MPEGKYDELERRVGLLERRVEMLETGADADDARSRRTRALNMWLRIGLYVTALLLMVFLWFLFKHGF